MMKLDKFKAVANATVKILFKIHGALETLKSGSHITKGGSFCRVELPCLKNIITECILQAAIIHMNILALSQINFKMNKFTQI